MLCLRVVCTCCVYVLCVRVKCTCCMYMCICPMCTCGVYSCLRVVCMCSMYMLCVSVVSTHYVHVLCVRDVCTLYVYVLCVRVVCSCLACVLCDHTGPRVDRLCLPECVRTRWCSRVARPSTQRHHRCRTVSVHRRPIRHDDVLLMHWVGYCCCEYCLY